MTKTIVSDEVLDVLFREARTHRSWQTQDVPDTLLQAVYELAKFGPTANNAQPMRIAFIKSKTAKEKLKPHLDEGNVPKVMAVPVTAIIAYDSGVYNGDAQVLLRNDSLGGAYFMLAARALGLDCGPMSGFNNAGVDAAFFAGTPWKSNFVCNLGYGDATDLRPRKPRLSFDETCRIL